MLEEDANVIDRIVKLEELKAAFEELHRVELRSIKDLEKLIEKKKAQKQFTKATEQQLMSYYNNRDQISQIIDSIDVVISILKNLNEKQSIEINISDHREDFVNFLKQYNFIVEGQLKPIQMLDNVMRNLNVINNRIATALEKAQDAFSSVDAREQIRKYMEWNSELEARLEKQLGPKLNKDQIDYVKKKLREAIENQQMLKESGE